VKWSNKLSKRMKSRLSSWLSLVKFSRKHLRSWARKRLGMMKKFSH